jgi:hypothetical protein
MKPLAKAVAFGALAAAVAFGTTYIAFNLRRWRSEADGWILCGPIDDGWLVAALASFIAYIIVFTPVLWYSTRQ